MNSSDAVDLAIFLFCVLLFAGYHVFYFEVHRTWWFGQRTKVHLWQVTKRSRQLWTEAMSADPKEAIVAVQTARNAVTGISILAAACAGLQAQVLSIVTDPAKLQQVAKFSTMDPLSSQSDMFSPEVKLGITLGALMLSMLCFAHSIRLYINLGFIVRVVPMKVSGMRALGRQCMKISTRAALYFTIGLRFFYAFIPLIMWLLGELAFLIATVMLVVALFFLDNISEDEATLEEDEEGGADGEQGADGIAAGALPPPAHAVELQLGQQLQAGAAGGGGGGS